jgi:hypothetical protein
MVWFGDRVVAADRRQLDVLVVGVPAAVRVLDGRARVQDLNSLVLSDVDLELGHFGSRAAHGGVLDLRPFVESIISRTRVGPGDDAIDLAPSSAFIGQTAQIFPCPAYSGTRSCAGRCSRARGDP